MPCFLNDFPFSSAEHHYQVMAYTWTTYQLYMMGLSLLLIGGLVATEFFLRKFDVLHVLYNQMLRTKSMKTICFNQFDVTNNHKITSSLFMMTRLVVVLIFCYIWQFCVIESYVFSDQGYPSELCFSGSGFHCFQTPLSWGSFAKANDMTAIDCSAGESAFVPVADSIAVSCYKLSDQNAALWLQTLAVANALGMLATRFFEVLVWMFVQSVSVVILASIFAILLVAAIILTAVAGIFSSLVNSWLGYVAITILPYMIYLARNCASEIRRLKRDELTRIQHETKSEFNKIARDFARPDSKSTLKSAVSSASSLLEIPDEGLRNRR
jgi:hypothetical protein